MNDSEFITNFDTAEEYIAYLSDTLIPDLLESENSETATDFEEAIYWINFYKEAFFAELENRHLFLKKINDTFANLIDNKGDVIK